MHAGFRELRMAMPMSLYRAGAAGTCLTEGAASDIARIAALWADTRARFGAGGPYLFGAEFTNADAMYAPVACRLLTYQPPLPPAAQAYCNALRAHPLGRKAARIGRIVADHPGLVVARTPFGGTRIVPMPLGEQLPRIC
jgi:glutathione S-transferase